MALAIAAERSGSGKTTVTMALLAYLARRERVQPFKVGPDYIDPMFHSAIAGRPCRTLDPVLASEVYVRACFARHCAGAERALIEGVMGLFDGVEVAGVPDFASTAHVARLLQVPVLLVLDARRLSGSVAAIAYGFASFDPRLEIAGVVLNNVGSARHRELLQGAIARLGLPVLGAIPRDNNIELPGRHLGLVPTEELADFARRVDRLATRAGEWFDWERLLPLLAAPQTPLPAPSYEPIPVRIGVARDRAFSFYYADNLDVLRACGAELVFWSPLGDRAVPDVDGLYFGGGFPEVFAAELAANCSGRESMRSAIAGGMPTYAECGGLMALARELVDCQGDRWPGVGVLPGTATMTERLTLGYREAIALRDSSFVRRGETVWGHEFHRSTVTSPPQPIYRTRGLSPTAEPRAEGWHVARLHASYVHLHWGTHVDRVRRWLRACRSASEHS